MNYSAEGQRSERNNKTLSLIEELAKLFEEESDKVVGMPGNGAPQHPGVKYLGGSLTSADGSSSQVIRIVKWQAGDLQNYSISVGPKQYTIDGSKMAYAEPPYGPVSDVDVDTLRICLNPIVANWSIATSMELTDEQFDFNRMMNQPNRVSSIDGE